jgi:hypothetical protein
MMDWRRIFEERRGLIVPLALVFAVNVAVLLVAVVPLERSVANGQTSASAATAELATARRLEKQANDGRASKARADVELKKFYSEVLPPDLATAVKTTDFWLAQASRDAGLTFKGSRFQPKDVRGSRLTRAATEVTLEGRYPNIRKFLYAIENAKEFLVIEKVQLNESGQRLTGGNGALDISVVVSTYYLPHQ